MSFNAHFHYEPIQGPAGIRILVVAAGEPDDEIYCWTLPSDLDADPDLSPDKPKPMELMAVAIGTTEDGVEKTFMLPIDQYFSAEGLKAHPFQSYFALSYVWGSDEDLQTISLEGHAFRVTKNLDAALRSIRDPKRGIRVWVDAICINQADPEEKKIQIGLMKRIYEQADFVHAQVLSSSEHGENIMKLCTIIMKAADDTDKARKAAGSIAETHLSRKASKEDAQGSPSGQEGNLKISWDNISLEDHGFPDEDSPLWVSWRHLFASPYFVRAWILQEFSLAKNIRMALGPTVSINGVALIRECTSVLESKTCKLNTVYLDSGSDPDVSNRALSGLHGIKLMINERTCCRGLDPAYKELGYSVVTPPLDQRSLIYKLDDAGILDASDERDKIFALLGLATDGDQFQSLVSYTRPAPQVYEDFACRFIRSGDGVKLLYQACRFPSRDGQPTWVPNWATKQTTGIEARDFTAGGETTPEVRIVAQKSQISVKGYILDTIVATSLACNCEEQVTRPGPIKSECICYPPGLVFATFITEGVGLVYANNVEDPMITLFETLIRATRDRGLDYYRSMGGFLAIMSLVGTAMPRREPDSAQPSDSTTLNDGDPDIEAKPFFELPNFLKKRDGQRPYSFEFLQDIRLIRGARFGVTSKNLLSLVPSNTRVGDKVFVMSGGGVPMVLRESLENEEGEKCYKLVGEAYVRGIMYGEGIGIDTSAEHIILV